MCQLMHAYITKNFPWRKKQPISNIDIPLGTAATKPRTHPLKAATIITFLKIELIQFIDHIPEIRRLILHNNFFIQKSHPIGRIVFRQPNLNEPSLLERNSRPGTPPNMNPDFINLVMYANIATIPIIRQNKTSTNFLQSLY